MLIDTEDATRDSRRTGREPRPGVVLVFSGSTPLFLPFALEAGTFLIGREGPAGSALRDERTSRRHAEISLTKDGWRIRDLGSRNGTFVDGVQLTGETVVASPRVIRTGDTVFVRSDDVGDVCHPRDEGGPVVGSELHRALKEIDRAAVASDTLLILGESGTGKELAAKRFHQRGPHAGGPFVAVNCAAIPEPIAERLLFGAKKGAYSGATADSIGHVQSADFGVLFLDEGAELDLQVQAKLLRVLEAREVVPLGASHGTPVKVRVCVATHRDLRAAVGASRFRADLYHRLAPPEVTLPPLRERLDEITQHVVSAIAQGAPKLVPQAKLVEACLLRHWPGNVRELRKHLQAAAARAASEGADRVRLEHLPPTAGQPIEPVANEADGAKAATASDAPAKPRREYVRWSQTLTREALERVLAENDGNVALAARSLGMGRSQMYREMERHGLRGPAAKEE
jgi:transcriptional regulator with GAF, ATPase, and Fis domain